jgi:hypothetical protein
VYEKKVVWSVSNKVAFKRDVWSLIDESRPFAFRVTRFTSITFFVSWKNKPLIGSHLYHGFVVYFF